MANESTEPQVTPDPGSPGAEETAGTETEVPTTAEGVDDEVKGDGTDSQVEPNDDPDSVADKPLWQKPMFWAAVALSSLLLIVVSLIISSLVGHSKTTDLSTGVDAEKVVASDDYDYALRYLPHKGGVIIDGGFPVGSTPEQKREIVAKAAAHDPFVLWYFLTRIYDMDAPNMKQLEDRDLRISWHQKLLVLLEASDFAEVSLEGQTFFNEGHGSGGIVTASQTTFSGKVPGTKISFPGSTEKVVKNNCVNRQMKTRPSGAKILPPRRERGGPSKGPDTTLGAARQPVDDGNAVRTTTPSYSGSGDIVAIEQQSTTGSTSHNDVGHAGSGAGGTTPPATNSSGETNSGGGATDTNPVGGVTTPATGDPGQQQ